MDSSLKKVFNKMQVDISATVLDDFYKKKIESADSLSSEEKQTIKDVLDAYKTEIKESIKGDNKKLKKTTKGTRIPTKYNRYMKQKMAELKAKEPELSNNEKFAKIAAQWKKDKDTWEDNENTEGHETA
jgi:hypothetical protein